MRVSKKGIIAIILAILLVVAAIVLGFMTEGFKNWDPYGIWERDGTEKDEAAVIDGGGNPMYTGKVYELGERMTFTAASTSGSYSSTGVTVEAVIKPDEATNKKVNWSVSWKNADAAFAKGKQASAYVSVTPQESGSTLATVRCLQPFGEQIVITVTSQFDNTKSANCTVDFRSQVAGLELTSFQVKDLQGRNINNFFVSNEGGIYSLIDDTDHYYVIVFETEIVYTTGTVAPKNVSLNGWLGDATHKLATFTVGAETESVTVDLSQISMAQLISYVTDGAYTTWDDSNYANNADTIIALHNGNYAKLLNAYVDSEAYGAVKVSDDKNGDRYKIKIVEEYLPIPVTSLSLQGNLIVDGGMIAYEDNGTLAFETNIMSITLSNEYFPGEYTFNVKNGVTWAEWIGENEGAVTVIRSSDNKTFYLLYYGGNDLLIAETTDGGNKSGILYCGREQVQGTDIIDITLSYRFNG